MNSKKRLLVKFCILFIIQTAFAKPFEGNKIKNTLPFETLSVCSNHSCRKITTIYAFNKEWEVIRSLFWRQKIKTPAEERKRIKEAVGLMESLVARLVGTSGDEGGNSLFITEGRTDCVDESTNTTHYIQMMVQDKLVRFHRITEKVYRFFPHWTAVMEEKATGQKYAVDSWFYDNAVPPVIYPLEAWLAGRTTQKGDYTPPLGIDLDALHSVAYTKVSFRETTSIVEHK